MEKNEQSNCADTATDASGGHLCLQVTSQLIPLFFQLLGQGFRVNVQTGATVKDLLCRQLGIGEDYLAQRIQTIFLNSKVVDDVDSALVAEESTLALSGAMPGLAGAILRSGGIYAAMRIQNSHEKDNSSFQAQPAKITLKLMNMVAKELGPGFLKQGIWFNGEKLQEFIKHHQEELKAGGAANELDGEPVEINNLLELDWDDKTVFLQVRSEKTV